MKNIFILFFCLLGIDISAQIKKDTTPPESILSYGITTNTNSGIVGGGMLAHSKTAGTFMDSPLNRVICLELVNVKHPKEFGEAVGNTANFVYGKQNYLLVARPEFGYDVTLFQKKENEGLGLNALLSFGPSIGIEKPYYVEYEYGKNLSITEPYDPQIHTDPSRLVSAGKFWTGFNQAKINLGGHIKTAITLDVSTFNDAVVGIQVGFLAEYFSKEPQIMAFATNKKFYPSGYLTLFIGKRR